MRNKRGLSKEIERLFREKARRRKELARLPFEKKILILLELQKIARDLGVGPKKASRFVWEI